MISSFAGENFGVRNAKDRSVHLNAEFLRTEDRVKCNVPGNLADIDRDRHRLDRLSITKFMPYCSVM